MTIRRITLRAAHEAIVAMHHSAGNLPRCEPRSRTQTRLKVLLQQSWYPHIRTQSAHDEFRDMGNESMLKGARDDF